MIEREGKTRTAVCDYCGEARPGYMSAASAKAAVKEAGWLEGRIERKHILYCPECAGYYAAERREPYNWGGFEMGGMTNEKKNEPQRTFHSSQSDL